jgi:hypothetical protein
MNRRDLLKGAAAVAVAQLAQFGVGFRNFTRIDVSRIKGLVSVQC